MKSPHSDMKNFARGGQITLHNIRMAFQVVDKVLILVGLVFLLVTGTLAWKMTSQ